MPTAKQRPASVPAAATMLLGIGLLMRAALRWCDNGWGSLVWLLAMIMFLIRTPHSLRNRANVLVEAGKIARRSRCLRECS